MPAYSPWLADYVKEFTTFPNGGHDDMVDATVQGITTLLDLRNKN